MLLRFPSNFRVLGENDSSTSAGIHCSCFTLESQQVSNQVYIYIYAYMHIYAASAHVCPTLGYVNLSHSKSRGWDRLRRRRRHGKVMPSSLEATTAPQTRPFLQIHICCSHNSESAGVQHNDQPSTEDFTQVTEYVCMYVCMYVCIYIEIYRDILLNCL